MKHHQALPEHQQCVLTAAYTEEARNCSHTTSSLDFYFFIFISSERQRHPEEQRPPLTARTWPGGSHEPGTQSGSPRWAIGTTDLHHDCSSQAAHQRRAGSEVAKPGLEPGVTNVHPKTL